MADIADIPSKNHFTSDFQEFETRESGNGNLVQHARVADSVRLGLTVLASLAGLTILGTSADSLSVYHNTHLGKEFFLPLWPSDFDIRPTTALVICSAIIFISSAATLLMSKLPPIRSDPVLRAATCFLSPAVCLIASLIATSFFYGVNTSNTTSSLKSWSCQWSSVVMTSQPHWGTLCKESKAGLYLMVMLIPVEVLILGAATFGWFTERKLLVVREVKGSPALS